MKNFNLLIGFLLVSSSLVNAQTFSIGATSPNPNAALHVVSPTNNQGVLMPRLTTAQRTAMVLTATDIGLQLYDTDLKGIYVWDGAGWRNAGLVLPLVAGVSSASNAVDITNSGTGNSGYFRIANTASLGNAVFATSNTSNDRPSIYSEHTGTGSGAGAFKITNAANGWAAVYGESNGTGSSGYFKNTNAANTNAALYAESNGGGAAVYGWQIGTGYAGYFNIANNASTAAVIRAVQNGLGDGATFAMANATNTNPTIRATAGAINSAGLFSIGNASNPSTTLTADNLGTGSAGSFTINNSANGKPALFATSNSNNNSQESDAIRGIMTGTGGAAGSFTINNTASGIAALYAQTNGTSNAGFFKVTNPANANASLFALTDSNSGGAAVVGHATGTQASGGAFRNLNAANTYSALYAFTSGTGAAIQGQTSTGWAAIQGTRDGATNGNAGFFEITNAANTYPALHATTLGTGAAILAQTSTGFTAIQGIRDGATNGLAGKFEITNAANTYPALQAITNGTGSAGSFIRNNAGSSGSGLFASTNSNVGGTAMEGSSSGTAGLGGSFLITNAANNYPALRASTLGTGAAIQAQTSTGFAAIQGIRDGATSGLAGKFEITNAANTSPAVYASTVGTGNAITAIGNVQATKFVGDGSLLTNLPAPSNLAFPFSNAVTASPSPATSVFTLSYDNAASARLMRLENLNASNPGSTLSVLQQGTGLAGYFQVNNAANGGSAIIGTSNSNLGGSPNAPAAIYGESTGSGSNGGAFRINNTGSPWPALYSETNGTGSALTVHNIGASGEIAIFVSSSLIKARIDKTGKGFFNGGTQTGGADVAEMFDVEGARQDYEPGDVLVISESTDRTVEKSSEANSTKVVGVYATKPGVTLTEKGIDENLDQLVPMGVIGVIPTKVCLENGPIKRGDLLVTSSKKGHAMKAIPIVFNGVSIYPTGAVLGKALENFDATESGVIKVLVNVK